MARNLVRFDPFADFAALERRLFNGDRLAPISSMKMPTTDIYTEDDNKMTVEAHLPNFDESDITVDIDAGTLVIQAEKHEKDEDKDKKYVLRESSMSFYRSIVLPEQADTSKITASFSKGVLKVSVPFGELPSPTRVPIEGAKPAKD